MGSSEASFLPSPQQFASYLKYAPVYPCVAQDTKVQPTHPGDAAKAILAALGNPNTRELQYDLGGPEVSPSHFFLVWGGVGCIFLNKK